MSNTMQIIGAAMRAEADALHVTSVNIANAETTAYRRLVSLSRVDAAPFADLLGAAEEPPPVSNADPSTRVAVDLRPGTLRSTTEPLHVALDGPGFFLLQAESQRQAGDVVLTRRGDLKVSADGYLTAFNGMPVLGRNGAIFVGAAVPTINAQGGVSVDNQVVDELRIVDAATANIVSFGDGTYSAKADAVAESERTASIRQGFLETSNVSTVNEVVQLLDIVRRFETEQKFARAFDGMMEKAISELGRTT